MKHQAVSDEVAHRHWCAVLSVDVLCSSLRSQFFAFVVLSGFCGLDTPNTIGETMYSIVVVLIGVLVVSFVTGEMVDIMSNMDALAVEHEKRTAAVDEFCRHSKLPLSLQQRVRRFLDHEWSVQRGADPNKALAALPPMLRLQLKMEICGDAIRRTPFFNKAADATLLAVVTALRFETYPPNETIFVAGQIGDKLYIISRGLVAIQIPHPRAATGAASTDKEGVAHPTAGPLSDLSDSLKPLIVKTVGKGSWFGEGALLKSGRRTASAVARSSCDLLVLPRKDFLKIVQDDPEFAEHLRSIMEARLHIVARKKAQAMQMHQLQQMHQHAGRAGGTPTSAFHPRPSLLVTDRPTARTPGLPTVDGHTSPITALAHSTSPPVAAAAAAQANPVMAPQPRRQSMFVNGSGGGGLIPSRARVRTGASAALSDSAGGNMLGGLGVVAEGAQLRAARPSLRTYASGRAPPLRSLSGLTTARDHRVALAQHQRIDSAALPSIGTASDDSMSDMDELSHASSQV